tara:strand:+ start:787 stop:1221 length:435 start_codon:yes stop_codon:yes gene_type:complete
MGKIVQADTFHGQTMFLNWRGYHGNAYTSFVMYDSGMTTTSTYPYATIMPPFKGCINKISIVNNPYSSYNSGPTGSGASIVVEVNGTQVAYQPQSYQSNVPGQIITFDFGETVTFNAGDKVKLKFSSSGVWRYYTAGIQLMSIA